MAFNAIPGFSLPSAAQLTQPQDDAANLLAAFQASTNGEHALKRPITMKQFRHKLHR
jgi:hypothetical protein